MSARLVFVALLTLTLSAQGPKVLQHMLLFESTGTDLNVSETLLLEGGGKVQVAIPLDATLAGTRGGSAAKTAKPGVYDVTVAPQQGEARVDVNWTMPFIVPEELSGRIFHDGTVRMVFPKGIKASGAMLESNGTEPTTLASIYTLKGRVFKIAIDGAGSLRSQQAPPEDQEQGPPIDQILPRIYDKKYLVLGLTLGILAIGFLLNYRASVKG